MKPFSSCIWIVFQREVRGKPLLRRQFFIHWLKLHNFPKKGIALDFIKTTRVA